MDEAKRMEEGINSPHNGGGDSIEHDNNDTMKGESVHQPKEPDGKHKTKRVATLDAFRGLTIVVSIHFFKDIILQSFLHSS